MTAPFYEKCYKLLTQIPKGKVTSYKELANTLDTKAYRAVGTAMAKNPNPIVVPCHRVVKQDGSIGNYALGINKKIELLQQEGLEIKEGKIVFTDKNFHYFNKESK